MEITEIDTRALHIPYALPVFGAKESIGSSATVILVEVRTDDGIVGYGESIGTPSPEAIQTFLSLAAQQLVGRDPFLNTRLLTEIGHALFRGAGNGTLSRLRAQVLSGIEMALWDVMGKAVGRPVHALLGGAVRDEIRYFGFARGGSPEEIAADARELYDGGYEVIYLKVGRDSTRDVATLAAVRDAIGPRARIRVDVNEQWSPVDAARMLREFATFGVEIVEQPTSSESVESLARVRGASPLPIAADQSVCTSYDAFAISRHAAADLIVAGPHQVGGLASLSRIAHVVEAGGLNLCIHGMMETGISTCASNQIAATISNLDDGNQHMTRFLAWDLIASPDVSPQGGSLPVLDGPGLGFELDWDGVERAERSFAEARSAVR